MAVKIRLKRFGRRHSKYYRISAMDLRRPRDGRVLEELGWYAPEVKAADKQVSFDRARVEYWLSVGAQPSDTVRQLLVRGGVTAAAKAKAKAK